MVQVQAEPPIIVILSGKSELDFDQFLHTPYFITDIDASQEGIAFVLKYINPIEHQDVYESLKSYGVWIDETTVMFGQDKFKVKIPRQVLNQVLDIFKQAMNSSSNCLVDCNIAPVYFYMENEVIDFKSDVIASTRINPQVFQRFPKLSDLVLEWDEQYLVMKLTRWYIQNQQIFFVFVLTGEIRRVDSLTDYYQILKQIYPDEEINIQKLMSYFGAVDLGDGWIRFNKDEKSFSAIPVVLICFKSSLKTLIDYIETADGMLDADTNIYNNSI